MLRTVIFDFDGVITDSEILHLRAFNKILARFNLEIDKKNYYTKYLGYTDADCFKQLIADGLLEIDKRQIPELIEKKITYSRNWQKQTARQSRVFVSS